MSSEEKKKNIGAIEWRDLTVENAEEIRDFYSEVVGWQHTAASMGDYDDFNMNLPDSGDTIAGICHARGGNASLPNQWLMYVRVEDVHESAERCRELGGTVMDGPKGMGSILFCVIKDPQGAVIALISDKPG